MAIIGVQRKDLILIMAYVCVSPATISFTKYTEIKITRKFNLMNLLY